MRVGVFSTYRRLAVAGYAHAQWRHKCPFCDRNGPEDLPHFLLECPAWSAERGRFLVPVLRRAKVHEWLGVAERRVDATYVLLGGSVEGRSAVSALRGGKKRKKKAEQKEVENVEPVGDEEAQVGAAAAVAPVPAGVAAAAVAVANDAMGRVAAAPPDPGQNKSLRSSGLNWLLGRAELPAPGGGMV
jgi:hypothetical protein